jgi:hypothetical protein
MVMDDLIAPYERLVASRAEMARAEGISVRTLQRRLQAQRQRLAEEADSNELPVVPLVYGQRRGSHYRLDDDQESDLPPGLFRIGRHFGRGLQVQHAGRGQPVEEPPKKSKHKHRPKIDGKRVG